MALARRHVVSVLFCDLVGSTALLEQLGDAGSDELRRDPFAALRRPVDAFGGIEIKSQGDGLMVAFATGPSDAVACAIALQRATARLAARDEGVPVAIRVGVAMGEATGEDGDWFGRPVVEAARLCSAAQPSQVLATATVAGLVDHDLAARATSVGALPLKGFTEAVPSVVFDWSEDASGDSSAAAIVALPPMLDPTGLLPFVGRPAAHAELRSAWTLAVSGYPTVVTLCGAAGTGKTRLVAEFSRALTREQGGAYEPLARGLRRHQRGAALVSPTRLRREQRRPDRRARSRPDQRSGRERRPRSQTAAARSRECVPLRRSSASRGSCGHVRAGSLSPVGSEVLALADLPATDPTVGLVGVAASTTNPDAPSAPPDETDRVTAGFPLTSVDTGSGPRLATSGAPGGGSRVALLDGTSIVWSDSGPDGSVSGDRLDPDLGLLHSLALSPDGRTAFVVGSRGFALVALDGRDALERSRIALDPTSLTGILPPGVSPDGSRLVLVAGLVGSMTSQVVDLATGQAVSPVVSGRAGFLDDRTIVAGTVDPDGLRLRTLDVETGRPTGEETLIPGFSPTGLVAEDAAGGRLVLTGRFDGDVATDAGGAVLVERDQDPRWRRLVEIGAFESLALRPGHREAWTVAGGRLERVDLATGKVEAVPAAGDGLSSLAFSGDGLMLFATAGPRVLALDMTAGLPTTVRLVGVLASDISLLAADATGARVAAITSDGPVLLDTSSGETLPVGQTGAAQQLDFLPDGDLLVIDDTDARVIALDVDRAVAIACRVAGRVQTLEEWQRYGPQDAPYAPACAPGG